MARQIILDTETTGLETRDGHRLIELGCVEMVNRRLTGNNLHIYFQPDRTIDQGAIEVHGITNEFLEDKPRFKDKFEDILNYLKGAELVIHNAPFDVGFLNYELSLIRPERLGKITDYCSILDTLVMAREMHPGQRNSLDALCKRYEINNQHRTLHGALLDAEILANVYIAMTSGQESLFNFSDDQSISRSGLNKNNINIKNNRFDSNIQFKKIELTSEDIQSHQNYLKSLNIEGESVW